MDFLKGKNRLGLYLLLLAVLAVGALAAVWSVTGTGAYLTGEDDWQTLAGDYRIGTIDYTVRVNDELLLGRNSGSELLKRYYLAVPLLGGVRMYDSTLTDDTVRTKEFTEGATLMRVRVTNYSKNMVDVTAQFTLQGQTGPGVPIIRALPLPVTLDKSSAATFDCRQYVLNTLGLDTAVAGGLTAGDEARLLSALDAAYTDYLDKLDGKVDLKNGAMTLEMGLLPGSSSVNPGVGDDKVLQDKDTQTWCYYKDVFLVVWTEYAGGEFNTAVEDAGGAPRQGRFDAVFTVGQLD